MVCPHSAGPVSMLNVELEAGNFFIDSSSGPEVNTSYFLSTSIVVWELEFFKKYPKMRDIRRDMHKNGGLQPFHSPLKVQKLVGNCRALCFCWKFIVNLSHCAKFELIWSHRSREKAPNAVVGMLLHRGGIQDDWKTRGSNFQIAWKPWGIGSSNFAQCCNHIRTWNWQNLKAVAHHSPEKYLVLLI